MSSFTFVNLALGALALVLLLPLRSGLGSLPKVALGFCVGIAAGIVAINTATSLLQTSRDTNVLPTLKYLWDTADASRPQILLVGSSYTQLGVDGSLIEQELHKKGYDMQVLELAKVGNFMVSQDYVVDSYLARAKKVPEYIFFELGPEYYNDTGSMGPSYLETGTAIADHAPNQFWWRAQSIAAYPATPSEKVTKFWNLSTHTLFHLFDFGLSGQLIAYAQVSAQPGFLPMEAPHTPVTPAELAQIRQSADIVPDPPSPRMSFILRFRRMQVRKLETRGAKVVGFYQPVMTPTNIRAYGDQTCSELRGIPCITGDDPQIRRQLDSVALWYDPVHLLHPGAEKYSIWFADRLAAALASSRHASE